MPGSSIACPDGSLKATVPLAKSAGYLSSRLLLRGSRITDCEGYAAQRARHCSFVSSSLLAFIHNVLVPIYHHHQWACVRYQPAAESVVIQCSVFILMLC
jgi:hypothetical protein